MRERAASSAHSSSGARFVCAGRDGVWLVAAGAHGSEARMLVAEPGVEALLAHPTLPLIYGVKRHDGESIVAWRRTEGALERLAEVALPSGEACHAALGADGRMLGVAQYAAGTVALLELGADGLPAGAAPRIRTVVLPRADPAAAPTTATDVTAAAGSTPAPSAATTTDPARQDGPHPHHVLVRRGDPTAFVVTDLGSDTLWRVPLDGAAPTALVRLRPGTGPRHTVELADARLVISAELRQGVVIVDPRANAARYLPSVLEPRGSVSPRVYPSDLVVVGGSSVVVANRGADSLTLLDVASTAGATGAAGAADSTAPDEHTRSEHPSYGAWPLSLARATSGVPATTTTIVAVADRDSDAVALLAVDRDAHTLRLVERTHVLRPTALLALP